MFIQYTFPDRATALDWVRIGIPLVVANLAISAVLLYMGTKIVRWAWGG